MKKKVLGDFLIFNSRTVLTRGNYPLSIDENIFPLSETFIIT